MFLGLSDLDWITRISLEREREREVGFWWLESFFWRILVSLRVEESKERKKLEEGEIFLASRIFFFCALGPLIDSLLLLLGSCCKFDSFSVVFLVPSGCNLSWVYSVLGKSERY
jgi:hypothetical protein